MQIIKYLILLIFCIPFRLTSQNLIDNPGFENGLSNWNSFWTRETNVGLAEILSTDPHSGKNFLHIKHWGEKDWSFSTTKLYPVITGNYFEYSIWVKVTDLKGWSEISIVLYDSIKTVLNWAYGSLRFNNSSNGWVKYTSRFLIPEKVKFIQPRIIGTGISDLNFDDAELFLKDSINTNRILKLENNFIGVKISIPFFSFEIENKINKQKYSTEASYYFKVNSIDSSKDSYNFNCNYIPDNIQLIIGLTIDGNSLKFSLRSDSLNELKNNIYFPGKILSKNDEYLIIPRATGVMYPVKEKFPFGEFQLYAWKSTMSFIGITNLHEGYMIASEDPWSTTFQLLTFGPDILVSPQIVHINEKGKFGRNRNFSYYFVNDGYLEMCRNYKNQIIKLNYLKTFNEKVSQNPNVDKLRGAVDFWILDSKFRTPQFIDSLYNFGIDRAIFSLGGGWYNRTDFSKIIDSINSKGLLSSRYDIYTDVWPPDHPEWNWYRTEGYPDDIIIDKDGSLHKGWLSYPSPNVSFQGYYACSQSHSKYCEKWLSEELINSKYNCRFIDVELASSLMECYSPVHPTTRGEDAKYRVQLLDKVKNRFNLVTGSEEARDFAFPVCDYGEGTMTIQPVSNAGYDWSTPITEPDSIFKMYSLNPQKRIPLHGLVYHNSHVATWYTGDGQSKVPSFWDEKDLFNILYASMPLFLPPNYNYWQLNRERFLTSYHTISSIFREAGFEEMIDHQFLTNNFLVQQTEFGNGWKVIANFDSIPFTYQTIKIAPKGFYAWKGNYSIGKILQNNKIFTYSYIPDRIFINPNNNEYTNFGIRTTGSVFLKKATDKILLTFIGQMNYIDINLQELPWQLKSLNVYTLNGNKSVRTETLSNNWYRIYKEGNNLFYYIIGDFSTNNVKENSKLNLEMNVFPNPFNISTNFKFTIPEKGSVNILIYDVLGREVQTLTNDLKEAGTYTQIFDAKNISSGIYFCKFIFSPLNGGKEIILNKSVLLTK